MRITETTPSAILTLERLKAYANIVDRTRDDELQAALDSAILRVAQYADVALVECTIVDEREGGGEVQLWMPPVSEVRSVVDAVTNVDVVGYCTRIGNRLILPDEAAYTLTYTVTPDDATVAVYAPLVWQMAVAIWDGNTDEESKVIKRIPAGYVVH